MADSAWFVDVYERRYAAVFGYAARRVGRDDGHDVVAEVFLVLWRRQTELAPDRELAWLYATARRVVANAVRAGDRRHALGIRARAALAGGCVPLLDTHDSVDTAIDVRRVLRTLSGRDQEALLLSVWEGVTDVVGAEVTGCSPAAFRARIHRARKRLAVALTGEGGVGPWPATDDVEPMYASQTIPGTDEGAPR